MKEFTVLTINPGSSSTKMGVVKGDKVIVNREVDHHKEDFAECKTFADQEPIRMAMIRKALEEEGIALSDLDAVSGRGVGMDVVKRNITSLNGTVEIESSEGSGMKVSVRLPLTLAIMDGMSVGVGEEVYILPLSSVVESFQVNADDVSTVAQGSQLVKVRDEYMPVIALEKIFQVPRFDLNKSSNIMVVVEADGSRVALLVDELLGQHQVVVKNLESNYRKVPNVSGATILGDGTVALILDTGGLVRRARH